MKYYYDIYLNYYDYPINYYEWDKTDNIEHVFKIPILKVEDIEEFIYNITEFDIEYNKFILSDGINAIAIDLVNKKSIYISTIPYKDEEYINRISFLLDNYNLKYKHISKRNINDELRSEQLIRKVLITYINNISDDELKYIYYDKTNKNSNNINKIKKYLVEEINNNIDEFFINIYKKICKNT